MTLLEMIKKWERVKTTLEEERNKVGPRIMSDIEVAEDIIKDLRSMTKSISMVELKMKVLQKMDTELGYDNIENVFKLSRVLEMLCSQV